MARRRPPWLASIMPRGRHRANRRRPPERAAGHPRPVAKLEEGYDVVRAGGGVARTSHPTQPAESVANTLSHGFGRPLQGLRLYPQSLPPRHSSKVYASMERCTASFRSMRVAGRAKSVRSRFTSSPAPWEVKLRAGSIFKVILDLMVVKFLRSASFVSPIYLFGGFGIFLLLCPHFQQCICFI